MNFWFQKKYIVHAVYLTYIRCVCKQWCIYIYIQISNICHVQHVFQYQIFYSMFSNIKYPIYIYALLILQTKHFSNYTNYKIFSNLQQYKYLQYIYMLFLNTSDMFTYMIICKQPYYAFYTHIYIYTYSVLIYTYITLSIIDKSHIINTFETMSLCHYTEAF